MEMELKTFIEQALLDITNGVDNARKKSISTIAPANLHFGKQKTTFMEPQLVEFDLATQVVTSEKGQGKLEAKIAILGVSLGADGKLSDTKEYSTVSRIKFQVPVAFNAKPIRDDE